MHSYSCMVHSVWPSFVYSSHQSSRCFFSSISGAVHLNFLVQWFAQRLSKPEACYCHTTVTIFGNAKCITDYLLYFVFLVVERDNQLRENTNTAGFLCNIKQNGKTAFCSLTRWAVGYESILKPVMLFRLGALKHNMPRKPTNIHVLCLMF